MQWPYLAGNNVITGIVHLTKLYGFITSPKSPLTTKLGGFVDPYPITLSRS